MNAAIQLYEKRKAAAEAERDNYAWPEGTELRKFSEWEVDELGDITCTARVSLRHSVNDSDEVHLHFRFGENSEIVRVTGTHVRGGYFVGKRGTVPTTLKLFMWRHTNDGFDVVTHVAVATDERQARVMLIEQDKDAAIYINGKPIVHELNRPFTLNML